MALNQDVRKTRMLNRKMLYGWALILMALTVAYPLEILKHTLTLPYVIVFLLLCWVPFIGCVHLYRKNRDAHDVRYNIIIGYLFMYGFAIFTGYTRMEFTYIFPLITFLTLYRDPDIVVGTGGASLLLNAGRILIDLSKGRITMQNMASYEIQVALILLCFSGCYIATKMSMQLSEIEQEHEKEALELQRRQIILEEQNRYAYMDGLTGLSNRRRFDEAIDEMKKALPDRFGVIVADLNGLKQTNDTAGHFAGDELICGMAQALKTAMPEDAEIFRIGGDEFAVFLRSTEEAQQAALTKLEQTMREWHGTVVTDLSASIGSICRTEEPEKDVSALIRIADERMYKNKRAHYSNAQFDRRKRT